MTSQGTEGWWGEVTSEQTRGSVGPERDSDLEEPGLQALVDTGRVCKGHSSRREAGAGLSGAWSGLPENSHHILQDGLGGRPDPGFQCL